MSSVHINADTERCVGAGQCVLTDGDLFDQSDEDGTVVLLAEQADGEQAERAREAVTLCPSGALTVTES